MSKTSKCALEWLPTSQADDFTVFTNPPGSIFRRKLLKDGHSGSQTVPHGEGNQARVQPCRCYAGKALSITVRSKDFRQPFVGEPPTLSEFHLETGFLPEPHPRAGLDLSGVAEICSLVDNALELTKSTQAHGFLIVSGSTKSLKSKLARGLIHIYLEHLMKLWLKSPKQVRRPHLVTCEDDIEKYLHELCQLDWVENQYKENPEAPCEAKLWKTSIKRPDYTPRLRPTDVPTLAQAVDDALRMTPAIFYAGEVRDKGDWPPLYRLAQSHLVVVTTHASSLINTFEILQNRLEVQSGAQRSELAASVFGAVHMRAADVNGLGTAVPSCWVHTPLSVATFTSDGLASIVPSYARLHQQKDRAYCLGRRTFGTPMAAAALERNDIESGHACEFIKRMAAWDLRGE